MRPSRQFRPLGLMPLEDRVVLSQVSPTFPPVKVTPVDYSTPTPDNIIKGNVGDFHGLNIAQTLQAGNPVFEEITTVFTNGQTQYETKLIVPNKADNSVTTTRTINLRNNQGQEKIVDVATPGVTDPAGKVTNHNITTTLPGGGVETATETELAESGKTLVKGTITLPGGSTETYTTTVTTAGNKTTSDKTLTDAEGFHTQIDAVVTLKSELSQGTTTTTTYPDGTATQTISKTSVLRLLPPSPQ